MTPDRKRIYWDADVWLSYINGIPDRLPKLDALLADSGSPNGSIRIFTSELSKVEVAYAKQEQDQRLLDPAVEDLIDKLWQDRNAIQIVEYFDAIGREARQYIRLSITRGWRLRSIDAIHLATAKHIETTEFQTYEERLLRYSNDVGFPIVHPYVVQPPLL